MDNKTILIWCTIFLLIGCLLFYFGNVNINEGKYTQGLPFGWKDGQQEIQKGRSIQIIGIILIVLSIGGIILTFNKNCHNNITQDNTDK